MTGSGGSRLVPGISVVIPTIAPRARELAHARQSVGGQTIHAADVIVVQDEAHDGAAVTRQRGLDSVATEWVAFLDDDDTFMPHHLETCLEVAVSEGADLVYPWFQLRGPAGQDWNHRDPLKIDGQMAFGRPFDDVSRTTIMTTANFIPVTVLARTEAIRGVGGFPTPGSEEWPHPDCEDWGCWQRMLAAGAKFVHVPKRTWVWNWTGHNTSGRGDRWQ